MSQMKPKFDHVGIVVENIEKTKERLSTLFETELPSAGPYNRILKWRTTRFAMLSANGACVELLEPKEGPMLDFLRKKGDGAVCEICFGVDDIEKYYDKIKSMGITPLDDFDGSPLIEKKYHGPTVSGAKLFYLPRRGDEPAFEILQRPA